MILKQNVYKYNFSNLSMKKSVIMFLLLGLVLSSNLVLAYSYSYSNYYFPVDDFRTTSQSIINVFSDVFGPFFEFFLGVDQFDQYFFSRVLLLILIYVVVFVVLKKVDIFRKNTIVCGIIAFAVSVLGARYASEIGFIQGILLPYGAMWIAIAVFLPFFIYGFFVHQAVSGSIGRKLAWILFAAIFFGLWISRWQDVGTFNWVYLLGILGVAIAFVFDKKIHEYFGITEANKMKREQIKMQISDIEARLNQLRQIPTPSRITEESIRDLERRQRELYRKL